MIDLDPKARDEADQFAGRGAFVGKQTSRGRARPGAGRKATGKRKRLTVSLPADLSERVRAVAAEPSQFVALAVEIHLDRAQDE